MSSTETQRLLTIREAATYLKKTQKAVRSAVDRGSLPHVKGQDGVRRIPLSALGPASELPQEGQGQPREADREAPELYELVKRLEHLAGENGRLRALTEVAESVEERLRHELAEARAQTLALELRLAEAEAARSGRWFRKRKRSQVELSETA